jgi:protein-S-isoprenylcysteine O-methyltransferase Ste14
MSRLFGAAAYHPVDQDDRSQSTVTNADRALLTSGEFFHVSCDVYGRKLVRRRCHWFFSVDPAWKDHAAFTAAGLAILVNPTFPTFGRWDYLAFMTLLTLAFITAGFLPIQKIETGEYGLATAFVVSFFYEMFGFPLTLMAIDLLLEKQFPLSGFPGLKAAHLWVTLGLMGYSSAHLFSGITIVLGAILVIAGHLNLHAARGRTATWGVYRYLKHPQYVGIVVVTGGMLIEYPTLLGFLMWAILILAYARRSQQESREVALKQMSTSDSQRNMSRSGDF